jgi:hypothetical protein
VRKWCLSAKSSFKVARKFTLSPFYTYLQLDLHEYRGEPKRFLILKRETER